MKFKSENGYSGIDIVISVVVLFIFVSLIAVLSYNFNSASKELELKSKATYIAIDEIENMKNIDFDDIAEFRRTEENNGEYIATQEVENEEGFFKKVIIEDYADLAENKLPGFVKKVTVEVTYMFKGQEQKIGLSTVLAKKS